MKTFSLSLPVLGAVLVAALAPVVRAQQLSPAGISKQVSYNQTGTATVVYNNNDEGPWGFGVQIPDSSNSVVTTGPWTFTVPGSSSAVALTYSSNNGSYGIANSPQFSSQSALNASYPDGTYELAFNGNTYPVSLTGDAYSSAPMATVTQGTWESNGNLKIDPTLAVTISFSTNLTSPSQWHLQLEVSGNEDNYNTTTSSGSNFSQTTPISLTIPPNTLITGNTYNVNMDCTNLVTLNQVTAAPVTLYSGYDSNTTFTLQAGSLAPPTITSPLAATAVIGAPFSFQASASGGNGQYTFSATGLPAGLTIASYGGISGTPTTGGVYDVMLTVTDQDDDSSSVTLVLTVASFGITNTPVPLEYTVALNENFGFQIQASGGTAPYTYGATNLPPGLSVNASTGAITGTPTALGTTTVTLAAEDSSSPQNTAQTTLSLTVQALVVNGFSNVTAILNEPFTDTILVSGGTAPLSFSVTSGSLPSGLTLNSLTGVISGTPTGGSGQSSVTITVTDSASTPNSTTTQLFFTVSSFGTPSPFYATAMAGSAFNFQIPVYGGTKPYTYSASSLPGGLSLNSSTGVISGTPTFTTTSDYINLTISDSSNPTLTSNPTLVLTINSPFVSPPVSVTVASGQTVSFYAGAVATGTLSYQWSFDNSALAHQTDAYLLVPNATSANAGSYTCTVTTLAGMFTSPSATLLMSSSSDLGRLTNVSVRTNCGTGSANIIAGFVIGGSGTNSSSKEMLIRADGPELAEFSVPGWLSDPSLDVFNTSGSSPVSVGQNTGWCTVPGNQTLVTNAASLVYAFPLTTNSASSAVVLTLPPDQYTENVTGVSNDTGIALAEVYDVTNSTESYSPSNPRLINVSARANVATGAGNLIAGFSIGGSTDKTVLVRGTGPGLGEFSLTGLLAQPTLAVYSTSSGDTLVAANTGWDFDPVVTTAANSVYAFAQTSSADCSLLVTLPPGTYTANLDSNNGASGLALVEVYEVP